LWCALILNSRQDYSMETDSPPCLHMRLFLFISLILLSAQLIAQDTGEICIRTSSSAIIRVDGEVSKGERIKLDQCFTLKAGQHIIEIWAPKYAITKDTITIVANESQVFAKPLKTLSPNFLIYKDELVAYREIRNKNVRFQLLVGGAIVSTATLALISKGSLSKKWDELESLKATYNNSENGLEIKRAAKEYRVLRKNYNANRIGFHYIPLALSASFSIYGGWKIIKDKKNNADKPKRPVFLPQNPWN